MAYLAQVSPTGPVNVTLTVRGPASTTLPPAKPATASPPPPHDPLPLTGAPVLAGVDLALLLAVGGASLVTIANRVMKRA